MVSLGQITLGSITSPPIIQDAESENSLLLPTVGIEIPAITQISIVPTPNKYVQTAMMSSTRTTMLNSMEVQNAITNKSLETSSTPNYQLLSTPGSARVNGSNNVNANNSTISLYPIVSHNNYLTTPGSVRLSKQDRAHRGPSVKNTGHDVQPVQTPRLTTPNLAFRSRSARHISVEPNQEYKSVRSVTNLPNIHSIFGSPSGGTRIPIIPSVSTPLLPLISSGISFDSYVDVQTPVIRTPKANSVRGEKGKGKGKQSGNYSRSVGRTPKQTNKKPGSVRAEDYAYSVQSFFRASEIVPSDNSYIPTRELYDRYLCWATQHASKLKYTAFCAWLRSACTVVKFRGTNHVQNYHILGTPFIRKGKVAASSSGQGSKRVHEYPLPAGHKIGFDQLTTEQIRDIADFLETKFESLESAVRCHSYREVWHQGRISIALTKMLTNMTSRRIERDERIRAGKPKRVIAEYNERYELAQTTLQRAMYDLGVQVFKTPPYCYYTREIPRK